MTTETITQALRALGQHEVRYAHTAMPRRLRTQIRVELAQIRSELAAMAVTYCRPAMPTRHLDRRIGGLDAIIAGKAEYNQALNDISALTDERQTLILRMHRGDSA